MQALGALHGKFARSLGAAFSVLVRSRAQVELTSTHQGSYSEFLHSLPNPTSLHLVHCHPQRAPMVLEMSLGVLYPMIERLLGGKGDGLSQPLRPLTRIEQKLAEIVASKLLDTLAECWSLGSDLRFDLAEAEHNPLLMQVVGPAEPTLVLGFEVHLGIRSGAFRLALPLRPLDALIARLVDAMAPGPTRSHGTAGEREQLLRQLAPTEVTLSAELVAVPISLHDIVTLRPGDVIDTQIHRGAEVHVLLEGRKLFQGLPALQEGRRAVEITRCLPE
jgi:flagellar motor switch protein FliM